MICTSVPTRSKPSSDIVGSALSMNPCTSKTRTSPTTTPFGTISVPVPIWKTDWRPWAVIWTSQLWLVSSVVSTTTTTTWFLPALATAARVAPSSVSTTSGATSPPLLWHGKWPLAILCLPPRRCWKVLSRACLMVWQVVRTLTHTSPWRCMTSKTVTIWMANGW